MMPSYQTGLLIVMSSAMLLQAGCSDTPISPRELAAVEAQTPRSGADRELLLAVLAKLDTIEVRLEREKLVIHQRLDSLGAHARVLLALTPPGSAPGSGSGMSAQIDELLVLSDSIRTMSERSVALGDSLMNVTGYLAHDASDVFQGLELCAGLELEGAGELKQKTEVKGDGKAGVGVKPWDTGALADLSLGQRYALELGAGVAIKGGGELCWDMSNVGASPPARRPSSSFAVTPRMAGADQLEATLLTLQNQLGLDAQNVNRALVSGSAVFLNGDFTQLRSLTTALPLPSGLSNPITAMRAQLVNIDAVDLLCGGGNFGTQFSSLVAQGCGYIRQNDLPDLDTFLRMGPNFNTLSSNFGTLCNRFNQVVDRRLVVNDNLPWTSGTALNVRLFPSGWTVSC